MSTHNIDFYEDLTKIIFELSSNIIKDAPFFFCWLIYSTESLLTCLSAHLYRYSCYFFFSKTESLTMLTNDESVPSQASVLELCQMILV